MTQDSEKKLSLEEKHNLALQGIKTLLAHYKNGWDIFKKPNDWDVPVELVPGAENTNNDDVPKTWLGVVEKVVGIVAKVKYALDTHKNKIEIIDYEQMLSAYASIGMPVSYDHWSFGMQMIQEEKKYRQGHMGLAYEIVINTDPSIAYCMGENTKTMQMLVIAHASFGHNSFFKGNHMFRQFTDASTILTSLKRLKASVTEYEEKYGLDDVTAVLDAAHALQSHGVHRYSPPLRRTPAQEAARKARFDAAEQENYDELMDRTTRKGKATDSFEQAQQPTTEREENILLYIAKKAPHLDPWRRDLLTQVSDIAQYFYPQRQTQVMNEGWATFWHHRLLYDLFDMDLIDNAMMLEFLHSHTNVVFQPPIGHRAYSGFNPYALGFALYTDIKRICENPTDEDREYFPSIAGHPDWVSVLKDAMEPHKDESFISQYLSPKLMRDFRMFSVLDDQEEKDLIVAAVHNDPGYRRVRQDLSSQYNLGEREPNLEIADNDYRATRTLTIQHLMHNGKPIQEEEMKKVLHHIHYLWGHPVVLQSVDPDGVVKNTIGFPSGSKAPERLKKLAP